MVRAPKSKKHVNASWVESGGASGGEHKECDFTHPAAGRAATIRREGPRAPFI